MSEMASAQRPPRCSQTSSIPLWWPSLSQRSGRVISALPPRLSDDTWVSDWACWGHPGIHSKGPGHLQRTPEPHSLSMKCSTSVKHTREYKLRYKPVRIVWQQLLSCRKNNCDHQQESPLAVEVHFPHSVVFLTLEGRKIYYFHKATSIFVWENITKQKWPISMKEHEFIWNWYPPLILHPNRFLNCVMSLSKGILTNVFSSCCWAPKQDQYEN